MTWLGRLTALLLALLASETAAADAAATMALCRNAAIVAADRHGIPRAVLTAITLVETRTRRAGQSGPWPWTVNVAGKGDWFDSRAAALLHAQQALERGQTSFDVGCFQLNYRWHGKNFASIDEMFEPGPSGDYAARFLKDLFAETGDWIKASGLYHSRTAKHATRYRRLVAKAVAAMGGEVPQIQRAAARPRQNPSAAPRIFQVARSGGMHPSGSQANTAGTARTAGSVGLVVFRRGKGGLLRLSRAGLGS